MELAQVPLQLESLDSWHSLLIKASAKCMALRCTWGDVMLGDRNYLPDPPHRSTGTHTYTGVPRLTPAHPHTTDTSTRLS